MTIGTAIVVSIGILCVTFLCVCALGVHVTNKKQQQVQDVAEHILKMKKQI